MHDWFISQILQEDRGLATFLLERGESGTGVAELDSGISR